MEILGKYNHLPNICVYITNKNKCGAICKSKTNLSKILIELPIYVHFKPESGVHFAPEYPNIFLTDYFYCIIYEINTIF